MILLVLVVLWVVVLAPGMWRWRNERRGSGSIDSFHHSLHLLERTGPKLVIPAYRLETGAPGSAPPSVGRTGAAAGRPNLVLLRPVDDGAAGGDVVDDARGAHYERIATPDSAAAPAAGAQAPGPDPYRRKMAQRRRRDLLTGLTATFGLTALLGLAHSLRPLWVLTILSGVALLTYVLLAGAAQRMEVERRAGRRVRALEHRRRLTGGDIGTWEGESLTEADEPAAWQYEEPARAVGAR